MVNTVNKMDATQMYPAHLPPRKKDADCSVLTSNTVELRYGSLS